MIHKLTYISLGAGVQSTAMYVLSALGKQGVPRADFAVFADTGDEPRHVYEQLEKLEDWGATRRPSNRASFRWCLIRGNRQSQVCGDTGIPKGS